MIQKKIGEKRHTGKDDIDVCIISFPKPSVVVVNVFLYSFIEILEPTCNTIYVITGNIPDNIIANKKIKIKDVKIVMHFRSTMSKWLHIIMQSVKILNIQVKLCWNLIKIPKNLDIVIFYVGGIFLLPSILTAKILGKRVIIQAIGLDSFSYKKIHNKTVSDKIFQMILEILERIIFSLSNVIIVESKSVVDFLNLKRYRYKLITNGARYIDIETFQIKKELKKRENLIGYIGRLDESKGVMNFISAMPFVLKIQDNVRFVVCGDGPLYNKIKDLIKNNDSYKKVELKGWIPHDTVSEYLNELKLLIIPSYSEGLPTIVLESMACGTIVLANLVGGIPDVILDKKTGFIMEDNSPESITKNILRALDYPNIDIIADNARKLIEQNFTYDIAVERYKKILYKINLDKIS